MTASMTNRSQIPPSETAIGRVLTRQKCRTALTVIDLSSARLACQVTEKEAAAMRQASRNASRVKFTRLAGGVVEVDACVGLETAAQMLQALELATEGRPKQRLAA